MHALPVGLPAAAAVPSSAVERGRPRQSFLQVLEEGEARPAAATTPQVPTADRRPASDPGQSSVDALRTLVGRTLRAEQKIDGLITAAAGGKTFSAGQLLALQATAFRYSQTVEVLSRAADRLLGSIKQAMGTQV